MQRETEILKQIRQAQERMAPLRRNRRRCLDFAYGRQWGDTVRTGSGHVMSEGAWMRRHGRTPITNNLIRRAIKGAIGYWEQQSNGLDTDPLKNTDIRTLEEMMISGIAIQRVGNSSDPLLPGVRQVSPDRFFCDRYDNPTLVGATYHFAPSTVMSAFAGTHPDKALQIAALLDAEHCSEVTLTEVWCKTQPAILYWHDPVHAIQCRTSCTAAHLSDLKRLNAHRQEMCRPTLKIRYENPVQWEQLWLTEQGQILSRTFSHHPEASPYLIAIYPGLDHQLHSPVEDLIEPQKQINRLTSTLGSVIDHSAKGVLLYPADQLPRGMTWKEIRNLWDSPGSILPFMPTRKSLTPTQINASGRLDGAMQMLMLQLKMFDDMAGLDSATAATRGNATGTEMLKTGIEQTRMVLRDILAPFNDLLTRRTPRLS